MAACKQDEAALLKDLQGHAHWVALNRGLLLARQGEGLKGKLRVGNRDERRIYNWLVMYGPDLDPASSVAQLLALLDASLPSATLPKSVGVLMEEFGSRYLPWVLWHRELLRSRSGPGF